MIGHADERVLIDDAYGDSLACSEQAHPSCVAGVELALTCLNTTGAAEERVRVHHHFIAGNVCEVEVVDLVKRSRQNIQKRGQYLISNSIFNAETVGISD